MRLNASENHLLERHPKKGKNLMYSNLAEGMAVLAVLGGIVMAADRLELSDMVIMVMAVAVAGVALIADRSDS